MTEVSILGLDLAKNVFQAHGAAADGSVVFRRKLRRAQVLGFLRAQPRGVVATEACATAHYWAREIGGLGHDVKLIAPAYVKPYVKRQKTEAADAEAIAEAASRPTMRFVAVKTEAQQALAMTFRTRDMLIRQRTQTINGRRGHLAEYGIVVPAGLDHVGRLEGILDEECPRLPTAVVELARLLLRRVTELNDQIRELETTLRERAAADEATKRLTTIPGVGPVTAAALVTFAPPAATFAKGRDFAAWTGLTPRQRSSGGKERLGTTSKMGQRDIRRLLIIGAVAVVRWAARNGAPAGSWLERMMARKPRMLVAMALANRTARIAWSLMAKGGVYRVPTTGAV
jgi:transposase